MERATAAFHYVMLDVTTNDIDLEVKDTVADIAKGLRLLKVKISFYTSDKINIAINQVSYDLGVACDVLGNIGKELIATLQSSNLESLKSTQDYFLEQELQLNKFAPFFMENLNFNREEFIVLKSLQGIVSCLIISIKFYKYAFSRRDLR